jgi:hypothetical protein
MGMTIKQAIEKAIESGWKDRHVWGYEDNRIILLDDSGQRAGSITFSDAFLDPTFWQCLGKAMHWPYEVETVRSVLVPRGSGKGFSDLEEKHIAWKYYWHCFIDHLAEGKDAESFFQGLSA